MPFRRVTFVADHRQHDLSAWSELKYKLMEATKFFWQRPNDLNHPTKAAPRLTSVVQYQLGTHVNRMTPHGWTGSPIALEAFLHLHTWHARYPKDSGHKYCLELNTPSAGVYGIAFELHTVLQHQWKYDVNWLTKLRDFDLLTHYKKRQLCETALHSLGYDPTKIPCKTDPTYGHVQLDTSGEADAEDYDAQISALMEGRTPLSLGPSSSGATTSGLSGGYATHSAAAIPTAEAMPKSSTSTAIASFFL